MFIFFFFCSFTCTNYTVSYASCGSGSCYEIFLPLLPLPAYTLPRYTFPYHICHTHCHHSLHALSPTLPFCLLPQFVSWATCRFGLSTLFHTCWTAILIALLGSLNSLPHLVRTPTSSHVSVSGDKCTAVHSYLLCCCVLCTPAHCYLRVPACFSFSAATTGIWFDGSLDRFEFIVLAYHLYTYYHHHLLPPAHYYHPNTAHMFFSEFCKFSSSQPYYACTHCLPPTMPPPFLLHYTMPFLCV